MTFAETDPDARGATTLLAGDAGVERARANLYAPRALAGVEGACGVIGTLASADAESGRALLVEAVRRLAARGAARVLGPMEGDTWHPYRAVLPPDEQPDPPTGEPLPPFPGEPVNPPDAAAPWRAAGFAVAARYRSALVLAPKAAPPPAPPAAVTIRPLDPGRFDAELDVLHAASLAGFAANPYYAPIDRDSFGALYRPLRPLVDPAFVEIAEDTSGAVLGFLLCFAWPGFTLGGRPVLIAKSIAVVPAARGRGLGALLFARAHARAGERGFGAVVHALMHEDNRSTRLSGGQRAVPFRRYALFGRTP
jgi:GNAT superfamily N-acetyltransferase